MLWRFATIIFFSILLALYGCTNKKATYRTKKTEIIVAQQKTLITPLHFSGTLLPLYSYAVLSPTDARVTTVLFTYGQQITKGQILVKVDATKIAEDYRKAVSDYLEKKQSYENGLISFQGTEALYKAGVISKDEFLTARSRQNSDALSYFQSKYTMEKLLPAANISIEQIESLNLSDINKVNAILNAKFHLTEITASASGVALFPTAEEKKDTASSGRISVGDELKAGQRILSIGDLSGLSMNINVNEINVNSIKPNQTAIVTGDAFPGITLKGQVESVASQATPKEGESGLSTFSALLEAAWNELVEVGFAGLTMESVAARAQTGVAVLYRRWANEDQLVLAAIEHYGRAHPVEIPDTGTLRGDLSPCWTSMSSGAGPAFMARRRGRRVLRAADQHRPDPAQAREKLFGRPANPGRPDHLPGAPMTAAKSTWSASRPPCSPCHSTWCATTSS